MKRNYKFLLILNYNKLAYTYNLKYLISFIYYYIFLLYISKL